MLFNMQQLRIPICCILCISVMVASLSVNQQQSLRVRLTTSCSSSSMLRLNRADIISSNTGSCSEVVSNASPFDDNYSRANALNMDGSKVAFKFMSCVLIALGLCCTPLLPPNALLPAQAATGIVAGPKSASPGNTVSTAGTENKSPASKMSEEIAIEVVLSKRDAEKAKLTIVNAELSKYDSNKKALEEELRVLSRKLTDLDKSIQSKKDGLVRDGLVQKQAALQLERDEKVLKIKELTPLISSRRKDSIELAKRVVLDESYLKTKYADLQKKRDSLAAQVLKKDIQVVRKEASRLQATIQAEMQLLARNQAALTKVDAERRASIGVLKSVEEQISRLDKELLRQRADLERAQKRLSSDEKGAADLKSESAKSAADLKSNISQEKELAKKLKQLQIQLGKYK